MDIKKKMAHFNEKLVKESYTKDEVAAMLLNEAQFTHQKTTKSLLDTTVSKDDYNKIKEEFENSKDFIGKGKAVRAQEIIKKLLTDSKYKDLKTLNDTLARKYGEDNIEATVLKTDEKEIISFLNEKSESDKSLTLINPEQTITPNILNNNDNNDDDNDLKKDDRFIYQDGIIVGQKQ